MEYTRKVLVGTPSHDGRVDVWYCDSLLRTVREGISRGVFVHGVYTSYDSLIQRSRNSLVKLALEHNFDDIVFIDSDMEWEPDWFFNILEMEEDIIGIPVVRKSDQEEGYNVKLISKDLVYNPTNRLIQVDGVGTGFMKVSNSALKKLWDISPVYYESGVDHRMVFDVQIKDGKLISEDYVLCNKWKELGNIIWVDPTVTCNHIGNKKYIGNLQNYLTINGYK